MHRALVALVVLVCVGSPSSAAGAGAPGRPSARVPNELIVRFSARAEGPRRAALRDTVDADAVRGLPLPDGQLLRLRGDVGIDAAIARLQRSGDVLYAEPNLVRTTSATMNDPFFSRLWGLRNSGQIVDGVAGTAGADIAATSAWDLATGSKSAPVAVIDTGVAADHPDLRGQIANNIGEIAGNGIDDDANRYIDDVAGWDFVGDDSVPEDANGHGTHVAGTIAARGNDGTGVVGVAPATRIIPLRVLDADGSGSLSDVVSAYGYAARNGARVVNLSLGGASPSRAERDAITAAPSVLFVAAAGNGGSDGLGDNNDVAGEYPCAYDLVNVLCVSASDQHDQLASFSNYGATSVDLAAPGVNIFSDQPPSSTAAPGYAFYDGTSMATPHVSGAAALALAFSPIASVEKVKQALLDATDARPALLDSSVSGGRLNARRTLELLSDAPTSAPPVPPRTTNPAPSTTGTAPPAAPLSTAPTITPPAPSALPRDTAAPSASLRLGARQRISILRRLGLRPRVTCGEPCTASALLSLSPRNAVRARLGSQGRAVVIGRRTIHVPSGTSTRLTIRLTRGARRALGRVIRPIQARLAITFVDADGNRRTLRRAVMT